MCSHFKFFINLNQLTSFWLWDKGYLILPGYEMCVVFFLHDNTNFKGFFTFHPYTLTFLMLSLRQLLQTLSTMSVEWPLTCSPYKQLTFDPCSDWMTRCGRGILIRQNTYVLSVILIATFSHSTGYREQLL